MGQARKLESMLEFMCSDVHDMIAANLGEASAYVKDLKVFEDIRELFRIASKNRGESLRAFINAASLSDVFYIICESVFADDEVEEDELEAAASILSESLHRSAKRR